VFFRKRRPVEFPGRVFLYVGVPNKAIIGFADVDSINEVNLEQAKSLQDDGCITESELVRYIGESGQVYAITICEPVLFSEDWQLRDLKEFYGFNPPQSFSIIDLDFEKSLLEKLV
jgi:predicted transcriptional regulator